MSREQLIGMIYGLALVFSVKEYYRQNPVFSDVMSYDEMIAQTTALFAEMYLDVAMGIELEEIREKYSERIQFMELMTTKG